MTRVHGDVVGKLFEPPQAVEEPLGALRGPDREVRPGGVADEERVTGEQQLLVDEERAVLGPVPRRVQHAHRDLADVQHVSVHHGVEVVLRLRERMDRDTRAVLEREPAVPRDVVGVVVRLDDAHDAQRVALRLLDVLLDRERGVDDDRLAGLLGADQVGGAAEVGVDELSKQHEVSLYVNKRSLLPTRRSDLTTLSR